MMEKEFAAPAYRSRFDVISMSASLLCTLHCIALPVFFSTLPLLGMDLIENIWLELLTLFISLFIGGWAIWNGYRRFHRQWMLPAAFVLGICLMAGGNILHTESAEMFLKGLGALLLLFVHLLNLRWSGRRVRFS